MDVRIFHNGSDISSKVFSYTRESKICTGIGTLQLVLDLDSGITFNPWDEIDIEEGIVDTPTYYVTTVSTVHGSSPSMLLDCQDNSKRLVDFFVTDTFTIEEVQNTKKWITRFMDLAGVSVTYENAGSGGVLAPGTTLGMTSAYDQIMQLLQQSGWYMKFKQNGVAVVGQIGASSHSPAEVFTDETILSFGLNKNDKMLRNRAVVWGGVDPATLTLNVVDKTRYTPWNYDSKDKRAVALGNSTIPDKQTAIEIADLLLSEFAHITVEKILDVPGAYDLELGDFVGVESSLFAGIGQITTLAVNMSKEGLITSLFLDERCPRLFMFWYPYDSGVPNELVYIGTQADGVWRKDLAGAEVWTDYSTGLSNKNITDLHINAGVAACVDTNGNAYRTFTYNNSWTPLIADSLTTVSGISYGTLGEEFKARACIIDKTSNNIKLLVDTYSGLNSGNYLLDTAMGSGIFYSGNYNTWILEYHPLGALLNSYQVSVSGNFNVVGHDIENSWMNDVAAVTSIGSGTLLTDFGTNEFAFTGKNLDSRGITDMSETHDFLGTSVSVNNSYSYKIDSYRLTEPFQEPFASRITAYDDPNTGVKEIITFSINRYHLTKYTPSDLFGYSTFTVAALTSPVTATSTNLLMAKRIDSTTYRIFYNVITYVGYRDWDLTSNTVSGLTPIFSPADTNIDTHSCVVIDGIIHLFVIDQYSTRATNVIRKYYSIDTETLSVSDNGTIISRSGWTGSSQGHVFLVNGEIHYLLGYYQITGGDTYIEFRFFRYIVGTGFTDEFIHSDTGTFLAIQQLQFPADQVQFNDSFYIAELSGQYTSFESGSDFFILDIDPTGTSFTFNLSSSPQSICEDIISTYESIQPCHNTNNYMVVRRQSDSAWGLLDNNRNFNEFTINDVRFTSVLGIFPAFGYYTGNIFVIANGTTEGGLLGDLSGGSYTGEHIVECDISGNVKNFIQGAPGTTSIETLYNALSFFIISRSTAHDICTFPNVVEYISQSHHVVEREEENFNSLEVSVVKDRLDIATPYTLVTGERTDNSLNQYSILSSIGDKITYLTTFSGIQMGDFRTSLIQSVGEESAYKLLLFTVGSGIDYIDLNHPSPTINPFLLFSGYMASGLELEMIETTNNLYPYQYIFASFSGGFIQQDPFLEAFVESSTNLPSSRINIIRTDDIL